MINTRNRGAAVRTGGFYVKTDDPNKPYSFTGDDEVEIDGRRYEIYRGYENGSRGNYGIKCREK